MTIREYKYDGNRSYNVLEYPTIINENEKEIWVRFRKRNENENEKEEEEKRKKQLGTKKKLINNNNFEMMIFSRFDFSPYLNQDDENQFIPFDFALDFRVSIDF